MRRLLLAGLLALSFSARADASAVLSVEVGYDFGRTSSSGAYFANPDTGFVLVTNTGTDDFVGTLSLTGTGPGGPVADVSPGGTTLHAGQTWTLLSGYEGSNYGGFGATGLLLQIVGNLGASAVNFSIFDRDIHSGVFATNPYGETLDNFILQGGDSLGRDTGDAFEVDTQAHAFFEIRGDAAAVPEPTTACMWVGLSVIGLVVHRRRRGNN